MAKQIPVFEGLRRPVITEKATVLQGARKYVFEVAPGANKPQVKEAVERTFNVKVTAVNTMTIQGRWRRMGRTKGRSRDWKKAVVTLQPGDKIELFEGV